MDPDDTPTEEFPPVEDGPECGTAAAVTWLRVAYADAGGIRFADRRACCYRHVARPAEVLPAGADLIEVILEDACTRTRVYDGQAEITVSGGETVTIPALP